MWSENLNTAAGQNKMFKMAKQMRKDRKNVLGTTFVRGADGNVAIDPKDVQDRWRVYFEDLLLPTSQLEKDRPDHWLIRRRICSMLKTPTFSKILQLYLVQFKK